MAASAWQQRTIYANAGQRAFGRRTTARFQFGPASLAKITFPRTAQDGKVWLRDLSEGGISFVVPAGLEKGTELVLYLKACGERHQVPAQVRHSTPEPDGNWRIGCAFSHRISTEMVDALL
jgi:hypothetical protein